MQLIDLTFMIRKWDNTHANITRLRKQVFMDEFNLPLNFLRHKDDAERYHVLGYEDLTGRPIAAGCIHEDGHIGKLVVLPAWRKSNSVAHVIVDYLMHIAKSRKMNSVWLNAPLDSLDYFDRHNFFPKGEMFEYCGVSMLKIEACLGVNLYRYKSRQSGEA